MKKFITLVAFSPWLAYLVLSLVADPKAVWEFVSACLWVATPILVVVAALRGYGEGFNSRRARKSGASTRVASPAAGLDATFQPTQLGQLQ
mgnify:CR=1 FL=1